MNVKKFMKEKKFTVEDMINYGSSESEREDIEPDLKTFHLFTISMLNFEKGTHDAADVMMGGSANLLKQMTIGTKTVAFAAMNMRKYARFIALELNIKRVHKLKVAADNELKKYKVLTMERFYYLTGKRYLLGVGFR